MEMAIAMLAWDVEVSYRLGKIHLLENINSKVDLIKV